MSDLSEELLYHTAALDSGITTGILFSSVNTTTVFVYRYYKNPGKRSK